MAEETNQGVDYLKALKQSARLDTAAAAAPAREQSSAADSAAVARASCPRTHGGDDPATTDTMSSLPLSPTGPGLSGAGPDSRDQYQGTEKRRSMRYKCEGSAELREDGRDIRTWASFNDVSLHGCYVEAQATYPVGTILHMKLEANGVRVESKGNVRVTYPYLGMGIAFTDMSEENVACLRELLSKISRPAIIMGPGIASSLPSTGPLDVPLIANPTAALEALTEFFENRQMLMREDFLRILRKSQNLQTKP